MKVATITLYCNEDFRLEAWTQHFEEYAKSVYLQLIVNNGKKDDTELLQKAFPRAVILYSSSNNMVASYNLAIRHIWDYYPEVEAIFQITNDLRLQPGAIEKLYALLFSESSYGMISPILLKKDSKIVEAYGISINAQSLNFEHLDFGKPLEEIEKRIKICSGLPGGCYMTKTEAYRKIGLQDERIDMYGDEIDIDLRCAASGYKLVTTSEVLSWHQHINSPGKKTINPRGYYFSGRNYIYLAKKHFSIGVVIKTVISKTGSAVIGLMACVYHFKSKDEFRCSWSFLKGVLNGIFY